MKWGGSGAEQEVESRDEEVKRKWMNWAEVGRK